MLFTILRVIKFSLQDIYRNIWVNIVTVIILILTLFTVNMLVVVRVIGVAAADAVKEKIDISLYLKNSASEEEILALQTTIKNFKEVKDVKYVSKEEALKIFKEKHQDNPEILQSLSEIALNPLTPTLIIKPKDLDSFDSLASQLYVLDNDIIESRNFSNYKSMLDKINGITIKVNEAGLLLATIFLFISILVIFNSVRVAIYIHRREINIMKLVGATNSFIIMPFLASSVIFTCVGILAVMVLFYPFLSLLQPYLETFFVGYNINLLEYFFHNVFSIFGIEFLVAAAVNILASFLAVRKYSKV